MDERAVELCILDFAAGNYGRCAHRAKSLLRGKAGTMQHEVLQLWVISVQRQRPDAAPGIAEQALAIGANSGPWARALVELTLGVTPLSDVLAKAEADEQRCQALFYGGAREATLGNITQATALLKECHEMRCAVTEKRLAQIETFRTAPNDPEVVAMRMQHLLREANGLTWGKNPEAAPARAADAIATVREALGPDHPLMADAFDGLGRILFGLNRPDRACTCHEEALSVRLKVFGRLDARTSKSMSDVGYVLAAMGRFEAALAHFFQALAIREQVLGEMDVGTAAAAAGVGDVLKQMGDIATARQYLQRSFAIHRTVLGETDRATQEAAAALTQLGEDRDTAPDSSSTIDNATRFRWERLSDEWPEGATRLLELAKLMQVCGDNAGARCYLERALNIRRVVLGDEHPDTTTALVELGHFLAAMGAHALARPLLEEALRTRRRIFGSHHEATAVSLRNMGWLLETMGDQSGALPYIEEEVAIRRGLGVEQHLDFAACLHHLGAVYLFTGKPTPALECLWEALPLRRKVLGNKHPETAETLIWLGMALNEQRGFGRARACLEEALSIRREALGTEHPDVAETLILLARAESGLRNLEAASKSLEEALAIRKKVLGEKHLDSIQLMEALGANLARAGAHNRAEGYLERALAIREELFGVDSPETIHPMSVLGKLWLDMNRPTKAREILEHALSLAQSVPSADASLLPGLWGSLGAAQRSLGEYDTAKRCLERALALGKSAVGEQDETHARNLHGLALVIEDMGDFGGALQLYQRALEARLDLLGPDDPETLESLNNIAVLLKTIGRPDEARQRYEAVLAAQLRTIGEEDSRTCGTLNNIGALLHATGELQQARMYLERSLGIRRKLTGEWGRGLEGPLHNLAFVLSELGERDAAREHFEKALAVHRAARGTQTREYALILRGLACLDVADGRHAEALSLLEEVVRIHDRLLSQAFSASSERQRQMSAMTLLIVLHECLTLVTRYFPDDAAAVRTVFDMVLRRKGVSADVLAVQRDAVLGGRYPQLKPALARLTSQRAEIARLTLDGPEPGEDAQEHEERLEALQMEKEQLEAELAQAIPELKLEESFRSVDARAVADALPEGYALVEFVRFSVSAFRIGAEQPQSYAAFLLLSGETEGRGQLQMFDLGDAQPIDAAVAAFRAGVVVSHEARDIKPARRTHAAAESSDQAGAELRRAVFDPISKAVGACRRLFVAPDGDLSRLPFEVLPTADGQRLIDSWAISYLAAGRDLVRLRKRSGRTPASPVIAADPDYDLASLPPGAPPLPSREGEDLVGIRPSALNDVDSSRVGRDLDRGHVRFSPLPGTRLEAEAVAAMLSLKPHTGGQVTKQMISSCRSPWILHLATHGFFLEESHEALAAASAPEVVPIFASRLSGAAQVNPLLRSGIALAGANTWLDRQPLPQEAGNGILTAEDATGLDLLDTELVVLSACETGLGEESFADGVMGLRRSFVLAGARTVVMSLWKVPDIQTQELMVKFYEEILQGRSCADALRDAQLTIRARYPAVLFWGGFICQGDPGPMSVLPVARRDDRAAPMFL